jgi:hypothetical protein
MRAAALLTLLLAACGEGLPDPTLVEGLRVLAVRAEPPELRAGGATTTELTPLVVRPDGQAPDRIAWSHCRDWDLNANSFTCPFDGGDADALGEGATLSYSVDPAALLSIAAEEVAAVSEGARLREVLQLLEVTGVWDTVNVTAEAPNERVEAAKRIVVTGESAGTAAAAFAATPAGAACAEFGAVVPPNSNPVLSGVRVRVGERDELIGPATVLPAGAEAELFPEIDWSTLESHPRFEVLGDAFACTPVRETAYVSWFCDGGELGDLDTAASDPTDSQSVLGLWTDWTLPTEAGEVTCWVVLRDGRGGTDWQRLTLNVE